MASLMKTGEWDRLRLDRQCRRFEMALRHGTADTRSDRNLAAQREHYALVSGQMRAMEQQAKHILMRHGVMIVGFLPFLRFVRSLFAVKRRSGADGFALKAEAAVVRWSGLGCSREILVEIVAQIFKVKLGLVKEPDLGVELDGDGGEQVTCGTAPHTGSREDRPDCPVVREPANVGPGGVT